jgi:hypothetical protein
VSRRLVHSGSLFQLVSSLQKRRQSTPPAPAWMTPLRCR